MILYFLPSNDAAQKLDNNPVPPVKRIFFTYEDLSRDKLFLYLINKKIVTYGVIHSPLLHLYRYNIYVNTSKVSLYPNFLVSKHTDKLNYIMKAKNYSLIENITL